MATISLTAWSGPTRADQGRPVDDRVADAHRLAEGQVSDQAGIAPQAEFVGQFG